jgi:polysaccharide export outer membrane protein
MWRERPRTNWLSFLYLPAAALVGICGVLLIHGRALPVVEGFPAEDPTILLCQALSPAAPNPIHAVDCFSGGCASGSCANAPGAKPTWDAARPSADWQPAAQGEYAGHARSAHVENYLLRVDDVLEFIFRSSRDETSVAYELNPGDEIKFESGADAALDRNLLVQPDGMVTLPLLGQVRATRQTVEQLRDELDLLYRKYYKDPAITATPLRVNTKLNDLRATVNAQPGFGGQQTRRAQISPEGTIGLPAIGSVPAQGLTLGELKREINERYAQEVQGLDVTPVLVLRAARHVFVVGQVKKPGRYELVAPTTAMQAITLAGGWTVGGNLNQVIVFRRGDDWRLMATMLDLRGALYGKNPCPADEIWINDSDIVVVPKAPIRVFDDYMQLVFREGIYRMAPIRQIAIISFRTPVPAGFNFGVPGSVPTSSLAPVPTILHTTPTVPVTVPTPVIPSTIVPPTPVSPISPISPIAPISPLSPIGA